MSVLWEIIFLVISLDLLSEFISGVSFSILLIDGSFGVLVKMGVPESWRFGVSIKLPDEWPWWPWPLLYFSLFSLAFREVIAISAFFRSSSDLVNCSWTFLCLEVSWESSCVALKHDFLKWSNCKKKNQIEILVKFL